MAMECGSNEFFLQDASLSTFIRFRRIASQTLIEIHRQHLDAEKRDVGRELPIHGGWDADSTASSFSFSPRGTLPSLSHMIGKDLEKSIECVLIGSGCH